MCDHNFLHTRKHPGMKTRCNLFLYWFKPILEMAYQPFPDFQTAAFCEIGIVGLLVSVARTSVWHLRFPLMHGSVFLSFSQFLKFFLYSLQIQNYVIHTGLDFKEKLSFPIVLKAFIWVLLQFCYIRRYIYVFVYFIPLSDHPQSSLQLLERNLSHLLSQKYIPLFRRECILYSILTVESRSPCLFEQSSHFLKLMKYQIKRLFLLCKSRFTISNSVKHIPGNMETQNTISKLCLLE